MCKVPDNPDNLCPADIIQWHLIICRQVMQGEQRRLMGRQCSSSCSAEVEIMIVQWWVILRIKNRFDKSKTKNPKENQIKFKGNTVSRVLTLELVVSLLLKRMQVHSKRKFNLKTGAFCASHKFGHQVAVWVG